MSPEFDEVDKTDPFDENYLQHLNNSITAMEPSTVKDVNSSLIGDKNAMAGPAAGINANVFSVQSDVANAIKPENGVRFRAKNVDIGHTTYVNKNQSKMSLAFYNKIANSYRSLADISSMKAASPTAQLDTDRTHQTKPSLYIDIQN